MAQEYEVVSNSQFRHLNIFLVRMMSRTPHIHGEIELGMILDGSLVLQDGVSRYTLTKGDLYLVNSLEAHEFSSVGQGALILSIQLSMRLMGAFLPEQPIIRFLGSPRLKDHFVGREAHYNYLAMLCVELSYAYLRHQPSSEYQCFSLAAQLLYQIQREIPNQTLSRQVYLPMQKKTDRIRSVTNYIDENFTHKLLLEDIAQKEDVSLTYLSHLFKDTLGISFQDYLKKKRFEYACNLIATTQRKILDISISSGFSDVRYLTKLFQERYGCTPKEYRKGAIAPKEKPASVLESTEHLYAPQDAFALLVPIRNQMRERMQTISLDAVL